MALKYKLKEVDQTVGDIKISNGVKTQVTNIDNQTGAISWSVEYIPNFEQMYELSTDLVDVSKSVYTKTKDDKVLRDIYEETRKLRNRIRTHIRSEYPDQYKTFGPGSMKEAAQDVKVELPNVTKTKANNQITTVSGFADFILDAWDEVAEKEQEGIQKNAFVKQARAFLEKARGEDKPLPQMKEAYSGFRRGEPEDPDSIPFEPTGSVSEFKEDLRALFGKFKGDLKNPEFIKGVAQIMVNWKSLLRSQMSETDVDEGVIGRMYDKTKKKVKDYLNPFTEDEVDEASMSGAAGAYNTPYAFVRKPLKPKSSKKKKKSKYKMSKPSGLVNYLDYAVKEGIGATLGPGPKAGEDGVNDNAYVKQFKYQLVKKNKDGTYVQPPSTLPVRKLWGE